jgi:hypothetical protein
VHRDFVARPNVWLAGALALAVLAGCGGDDDEGEFSPVVSEPLTKVEFLREADRICIGAEAQIEAAADDLLTGRGRPDPDEVEQVALNVVIPALESEVAAIGALTPPPGDEDRVQAILDATERGIEAVRSDPRDVSGGIPAPLREAQQLAEAYGSRECGLR